MTDANQADVSSGTASDDGNETDDMVRLFVFNGHMDGLHSGGFNFKVFAGTLQEARVRLIEQVRGQTIANFRGGHSAPSIGDILSAPITYLNFRKQCVVGTFDQFASTCWVTCLGPFSVIFDSHLDG